MKERKKDESKLEDLARNYEEREKMLIRNYEEKLKNMNELL